MLNKPVDKADTYKVRVKVALITGSSQHGNNLRAEHGQRKVTAAYASFPDILKEVQQFLRRPFNGVELLPRIFTPVETLHLVVNFTGENEADVSNIFPGLKFLRKYKSRRFLRHRKLDTVSNDGIPIFTVKLGTLYIDIQRIQYHSIRRLFDLYTYI